MNIEFFAASESASGDGRADRIRADTELGFALFDEFACMDKGGPGPHIDARNIFFVQRPGDEVTGIENGRTFTFEDGKAGGLCYRPETAVGEFDRSFVFGCGFNGGHYLTISKG